MPPQAVSHQNLYLAPGALPPYLQGSVLNSVLKRLCYSIPSPCLTTQTRDASLCSCRLPSLVAGGKRSQVSTCLELHVGRDSCISARAWQSLHGLESDWHRSKAGQWHTSHTKWMHSRVCSECDLENFAPRTAAQQRADLLGGGGPFRRR